MAIPQTLQRLQVRLPHDHDDSNSYTHSLVRGSFLGPNTGPHTELPPKPTSQQEPQPHIRTCHIRKGLRATGNWSVLVNNYPKFQDGDSRALHQGHCETGRFVARVPCFDPLLPQWEGNGNPLQYLCLENPMDRGAWQAVVHGVAKSRTGLKQLSTHYRIKYFISYEFSFYLSFYLV